MAVICEAYEMDQQICGDLAHRLVPPCNEEASVLFDGWHLCKGCHEALMELVNEIAPKIMGSGNGLN